MTACMQPRCTGMIVDGYCDICGSLLPAGSRPFWQRLRVTRPRRGAWPNGCPSGGGISLETEKRGPHESVNAASLYRRDRRRLLRHLR